MVESDAYAVKACLMAVRIREDGRILCAAMHPAEPGDTYLHDGLHHILCADLGVLVTEPHERHKNRGEWWWWDRVPDDVAVDSWGATVRGRAGTPDACCYVAVEDRASGG